MKLFELQAELFTLNLSGTDYFPLQGYTKIAQNVQGLIAFTVELVKRFSDILKVFTDVTPSRLLQVHRLVS